MRSLMKTHSVILAVAFCVFMAGKASAFNVMPMTVELTASAGESYTGSIEVNNSNGEALEPVRVYMEDWDRKPNGDLINMMAGSLARSCSGWLSLNPTQFDVPLHGAIDVKYTFAVPANASGSYWTFILFEGVKKPTSPPGEKDGVQLFIGANIRYAVKFVINVNNGRTVQGKITEISVAPPAAGAVPVSGAPTIKNAANLPKNVPLVAKIVFSNTGNTYVKPVGFFEIRNLDGETVLRKDIGQFNVFPGGDKWIIEPIEKELSPGEYIAMAVLDYGGDSLVAGESRFISPSADAPKDSTGGK